MPTEERQWENPEDRAGYTPTVGLVFSPWLLRSLCWSVWFPHCCWCAFMFLSCVVYKLLLNRNANRLPCLNEQLRWAHTVQNDCCESKWTQKEGASYLSSILAAQSAVCTRVALRFFRWHTQEPYSWNQSHIARRICVHILLWTMFGA